MHARSARLVGCGLLAGAIINLRLIAAPRYYDGTWNGLLWALRRVDVVNLALFTLPGFVQGLCLVWVYAAAAARYGTSTTTTIRAALVVWLLSDIPVVMESLVPYRLRPTAMLGIDLVLFVLAAWVGGRFYQTRPVRVPVAS